MKTRIILYYLSVLLSLLLYSCWSDLPRSCISDLQPNSLVTHLYFSLTSPNEQEWKFIQLEETPYIKYEYKTGESIWLSRGHVGGNWQLPDYPHKQVLILRKTIPDSILNEKMLRTGLNEIAMVEVKKIVDSLLYYPGCIQHFDYHLFNDNDKDYYQYFHSVCFVAPGTLAMSLYYVYLPKLYHEYKSYYLFIYDELPYQHLGNGLISFVEKFKCIEDTVKN